ncbi:MAG: TIGR03905 family TSCPD domain-containing protein [Lachnospiraceae bacterium]|nr:TIGR03905 family TSCPD domain-containing protein [Lachnospiraceae bacterium]
MKQYTYRPRGVCSSQITYDLDDDGKIYNLQFVGGCNGNLKAIGRLLEGTDAKRAADILRGNDCKGRGTSCADQLARSIDEALKAD